MIDLGNVHGQRTFYTAGRSLGHHLQAARHLHAARDGGQTDG
jgi:hypothetical protein